METGNPVMTHEDRQQQFLALYLASQQSVRQSLRIVIQDRSLLDDACQAAALRLWQLFDSYDSTRPFDAWARGVAFKVALEFNRATQGNARQIPPEALASIGKAFDRWNLSEHQPYAQLQALEACLQAIPHRSRELIVKRYHQSLPIEEIARQANRSVGATYKAIERSLQSLAGCIRQRIASVSAQTIEAS